MTYICLFVAVIGLLLAGSAHAAEQPARWSEQRANQWFAETPWLVGCNFAPSNAINQLEMWQADTFDLETIERELELAEGLGFNSVRVFLHDMLWTQDPEGFSQRIDQFLAVADRHKIGVMLVLFDGVWDPKPQLGPQRPPKPGTHNSGWVQSPSRDVLRDPSRHDSLEGYVKGIVGRFKSDPRVQIWDIYNEPDNTNVASYSADELDNKPEMALALIQKSFKWAREASPSQPLTAGVWNGKWSDLESMTPMARFCIENSDVITFHTYASLDEIKVRVDHLKQFNRPLICTEYMARPTGCTFEAVLPYFKDEKIGAYNWGLVEGKTQTIYPWDSWKQAYESEPPVWFHDIFRRDGSPYRADEVQLIKDVTGADTGPQ